MANLDDPAIRPIRRISGWLVLGIFGLVSFLILLAVVFIPWDVPAPDDADLRFTPPTIAADKNAFTYFEAAGKLSVTKFPSPTDPNRDWTELLNSLGSKSEKWDPAFADEVLKANESVFPELDKGLACERYASPQCKDFSTLGPWVQRPKRLVWLLALKSKRAQLSGDYVAAAKSATQAWRLGQLVTDDAGILIEWVMGTDCQGIGFVCMNEIIADARTPEPVLQDLQVQLDRWNSQGIEHGYRQTMQEEYRIEVFTLSDCRRRGNAGKLIDSDDKILNCWGRIPYCLKPNMAARIMVPFYRNAIGNADRIYAKVDLDYPGRFDPSEPVLDRKALFMPNSMGKYLVSGLAPSIDKIISRKCLVQANVAGLRLKIALRLYEQKHGQLPDDLKALVPEFLKEIPIDPYDGQPFRYSKTEKKVWAVGSNLKDDGGKMRKDTEMVDAANSLNCDVGIRLGVREMKSAPPPPPNESKK
jgi:hypothetical protein